MTDMINGIAAARQICPARILMGMLLGEETILPRSELSKSKTGN